MACTAYSLKMTSILVFLKTLFCLALAKHNFQTFTAHQVDTIDDTFEISAHV